MLFFSVRVYILQKHNKILHDEAAPAAAKTSILKGIERVQIFLQ